MNYILDEKILYVFIDGASRSVFNEKLKRKTGRYGGKGIRFLYLDDHFKQVHIDKSDYRSYVRATNNDMEVGACVDGLQAALCEDDLSRFQKIIVVTDSRFVYDYWKSAYGLRRINGWNTKDRNPVVHQRARKKLIKYMLEIYQKHKLKIEYERVGSHQNDDDGDELIKGNNLADKSAVKGAQSRVRLAYGDGSGNRALFFQKNALGKKKGFMSQLPILGHPILIHIYGYRRLKKGFRYNYELVSWTDEHFTFRSYVRYDKKVLSAEQIYLVKINSSNQIEEIISEHTKEEIKEKMIAEGIDTSILFGKLGIQ